MSRVRSTPKYSHILKIQSEIRSGTKGKKYALKLRLHENRCPERGNGIKFMEHDKQASSKSRLPSKMSVKAIKYFPYDTPDILKFVDVKNQLQKTMKCSSRSARCQWIMEIWSPAISTIFCLKISTCISPFGSWRESPLDWMHQEIACLTVNLLVKWQR